MIRKMLAALALTLAATLPSAAQQSQPVTLKWMMWASTDAEKEAWQYVAGLVNKKHPEIKLELQTTSWGDYWTKLPTLAAANQLPDIVSMQSLRLAGASNILRPLDSLIKDGKFEVGAFEKTIIDGLSFKGQLYALPYDLGPWVLYYNRDLFEKYGVAEPKIGWTQAEFLAATKALTRDGNFGIAVSTEGWLPFVQSAGGQFVTPDLKLNFTDAKVKAAFADYAALVAKDKVAPLVPASGQSSSTVAIGRFQAGSVGMVLTGPWSMINIKRSAKFKLGVATIPVGNAGSLTQVAGSGFSISRATKNPDAAWKALQIITGPEAAEYLATQGRAFSARTAQQTFWYKTAATDVANAEAVITYSLQHAVPFATTANWNAVSNLLEQYAPLAFSGSQPAADVLTQVQTLATE